jgi:hypothetical protein
VLSRQWDCVSNGYLVSLGCECCSKRKALINADEADLDNISISLAEQMGAVELERSIRAHGIQRLPKTCSCGAVHETFPKKIRLQIGEDDPLSGIYFECDKCNSTLFLPAGKRK